MPESGRLSGHRLATVAIVNQSYYRYILLFTVWCMAIVDYIYWQYVRMSVWQYGSIAVLQYGSMVVWQYVSMAIADSIYWQYGSNAWDKPPHK